MISPHLLYKPSTLFANWSDCEDISVWKLKNNNNSKFKILKGTYSGFNKLRVGRIFQSHAFALMGMKL